MKPLKQMDFLSDRDLSIIFSNIKQIRRLSQALLNTLEMRQNPGENPLAGQHDLVCNSF